MKIESIDDFKDEYIWLIETNSDIFDEKIYGIISNTQNRFSWVIWLNNWIFQELDFFIKYNKLFLEKIIARWKWKQIMFLILYFALKNDLELINLKAEPLLLLNNEDKEERAKYLKNFYWYFWFRILNLFWNMSLQFDDDYISDFRIILNRLEIFIKENKIINKNI